MSWVRAPRWALLNNNFFFFSPAFFSIDQSQLICLFIHWSFFTCVNVYVLYVDWFERMANMTHNDPKINREYMSINNDFFSFFLLLSSSSLVFLVRSPDEKRISLDSSVAQLLRFFFSSLKKKSLQHLERTSIIELFYNVIFVFVLWLWFLFWCQRINKVIKG